MKRKYVWFFIFVFLIGLLGVQDVTYASSSEISMVDAGGRHNIALKKDGTVWAWGSNDYGQLGDGKQCIKSNYPVQVSGLTGIVVVDAGRFHNVALKSDGTVWTWGGYRYCDSIPVQVDELSNIVDISCGMEFTIALKNDGTVWVWGDDLNGKLGVGYSSQYIFAPVKVNISDVASIKAGGDQTLALKSNGELWTWGSNVFGECGDGTTTANMTPVYIMNGVSSIGAGVYNSFAIKNDGTVWGWGMNSDGQLGIGTYENYIASPVQMIGVSNAKYITGGDYHTMVLKNDGTVWVCGGDLWGGLGDGIVYDGSDNEKSSFIQLTGISEAKAITGGLDYTVVALQDGSVWGCGKNDYGQLGE